MRTINSEPLVIILVILGICASARAGIYLRRRFGLSAFMRRPYIGIGIVIVSIALTTSFAIAGLYVPLLAAICISSTVLAALIWSEEPTL